MGAWLLAPDEDLRAVVVKALLMYLTALVGLRVAHRRTLAQWTAVDFAAAVAVGAVLGRTAVATGQGFLVGATALLTLLGAHTLVTVGRSWEGVAKLTDHRVRVLVVDGQVRRRQLLLCGVTHNDLFAQLRQRGYDDLRQVRYVLYETKGDLSVVPVDRQETGGLLAAGLRDAADAPPWL